MKEPMPPLWIPSQTYQQGAPLTAFADKVTAITGKPLDDYPSLHHWSVKHINTFWGLVWDETDVIGNKGTKILANPDKMPGAQFFPEATLNFAENLLRKNTDESALIFRREDGLREIISWKELNNQVSRLQQAMLSHGVCEGDRIAAMTPNAPFAVIGMLAAASIGAIWSSCSPDFGEQAVYDRFSQIEPRLFFACDGYYYNGKEIDLTERLQKISSRLNAINIIFPFIGKAAAVADILDKAIDLDSFLAPFTPQAVTFKHLPFSHPLYILFSSGTTGVPKCIVHSAGGTLLQHLKEHKLHCSTQAGDKIFYFTTCGWMMWNWLVSALACEATVVLYDGSPFYPEPAILFDYAEQEQLTTFGTSAKYIDAARNADVTPIETHNLSRLRLITSTGSPLAPENFEYVYNKVKPDVHLASISGGTDIVGCFVGGNPWQPVHRGEIQGPMLAMNVQVWNDEGQAVTGEKGELVCISPFPSMPIGFWNDQDGTKYLNAYFSRFINVWCQGDFAEQTEHDGIIIHGRSDATLNPGGVRIGTAEIYNQVEQLVEIEEGLCVGQEWKNDTRVILFVRLAEGIELDEALTQKIKHTIRRGTSPRHVPAVIIPIADLPRTKSGKIAELCVRETIHNRPVKNTGALANPESLLLYKNLPALNSQEEVE